VAVAVVEAVAAVVEAAEAVATGSDPPRPCIEHLQGRPACGPPFFMR
jgi:hypothetical protein